MGRSRRRFYCPLQSETENRTRPGGAIPMINVMPWPAFPTDLMSIAIVVATQSKGTVFSMIGCIRLECSLPIN